VFTAYIVVTLLTAAANIYAAINDFTRPQWLLANMTRMRVPPSSLPLLGVLKAAGAVGVLVGIGVPVIGVAAAVGLIVFFVGAIVTALRFHYYAHLPWPLAWLLLAVGSLVLRLVAH
jgi:DoxX-like family